MYSQRLDDLMTLLQGRAVDPGAAVETMWGLQDERRDRRQARAAAQQDALAGLFSTASEAAAAGAPLDTLVAQVGGASALAPIQGALDQLYTPTGYSRLKPTLDAEDAGAISNEVYAILQNRTGPTANPDARTDLGTIRQQILSKLAMTMPPETHALLIPDIDRVINEAYGRAVRSPSSNYMDQLLPPPA